MHIPCVFDSRGKPWGSLVEGDEQLDWPNSKTCLE